MFDLLWKVMVDRKAVSTAVDLVEYIRDTVGDDKLSVEKHAMIQRQFWVVVRTIRGTNADDAE
jgi:hypothetical protein